MKLHINKNSYLQQTTTFDCRKRGQAYEAVLHWIEANGYKVVGPNREVYLYCPEPVRQDDESYATEIQFPVGKKEVSGRGFEVVNLAENNREDLLADLTSILYSFMARLYGQRPAKRKTEALVHQLQEENEKGAP